MATKGNDTSVSLAPKSVKDKADAASHRVADQASDLVSSAKEQASSAVHAVTDKAADIGHTVADVTSNAADTVHDTAVDVGHAVGNTAVAVQNKVYNLSNGCWTFCLGYTETITLEGDKAVHRVTDCFGNVKETVRPYATLNKVSYYKGICGENVMKIGDGFRVRADYCCGKMKEIPELVQDLGDRVSQRGVPTDGQGGLQEEVVQMKKSLAALDAKIALLLKHAGIAPAADSSPGSAPNSSAPDLQTMS